MSLRSLFKSLNLPLFRRRPDSRQLARLRREHFFRALPGFEPLEDRRLLAGTLSASLISGSLIIADTDSAGKNNDLSVSVSVSGSDLVISDATQQFQSAPAGGTLSNGNKTDHPDRLSYRRPDV